MVGCLRDLALSAEIRADAGDRPADVLRRASAAVEIWVASGASGAARDLLFGLLARPPLPRAAVRLIVTDLPPLAATWRSLEAMAPVREALDRLAGAGRLQVKSGSSSDESTFGIDDVVLLLDGDGCGVALVPVAEGRALDVYRSWDPDERFLAKRRRLEAAWQGLLVGVETHEATDRLRAHLGGGDGDGQRRDGAGATADMRVPSPPDGYRLRPYQREAADLWWAAGGTGILAMATGTGKTLVAIEGAIRCARSRPDPIAVVVITPFIHLVDQWARITRSPGLHPVACYEGSRRWEADAWEAVDSAALTGRLPCIITTPNTAITAAFGRMLDHLFRTPVLLVADEVHHLAGGDYAATLDDRYAWRMGLSATPDRWQDPEGTETLRRYFGGTVFDYGIAEAIQDGFLCPYTYTPVLVSLERDELDRYEGIVAEIAAARDQLGAGEPRDIGHLFDRRSAVLDEARGKTAALRTQIGSSRLDRAIVYCASRLQMGAVSDVLREAGYLPRPFTAEQDRDDRRQLLRDFAAGHIPALVAMRALDEGVDVPEIRQAHLLASGNNSTQFIQRRGRILRPSPGKGVAALVDYVTIPESLGPFERGLVAREVARVIDFAATSVDPDAARKVMAPVIEALDAGLTSGGVGWG